MASPFNVFRKNQRILMVVLVGLSMIAFIAFDSLNPANIVPITAALLGALALWLLSGRNGFEGWAIAAVGGVLGLVIGLFGPGLLRDDTAVSLAEGSLSHQEMRDLAERRRNAESLVREALVAGGTDPRQLQGPIFSYPDPENPGDFTANLVMGHLFEKEADRLGVVVSDAAVGAYLKDLSKGKLTEAGFQELRARLRVGSQQLRDALKDELRAQQAYILLQPRVGSPPPSQIFELLQPPAGVSPYVLWEDYKKLKTEAKVTAVPVPAEAFVGQVEDPSAADLNQFFAEYRSVPPSEGRPGFLVSRKVRLAYLELDLESTLKDVPPVTDEEVQAFYEANKDDYRAISPGGTSTPADGPMLTPGGAAGVAPPPTGSTPPATGGGTPEGSAPATPQPPAESQPPAEAQPPVEAPSPAPKPEDTPSPEAGETPADPPAGQESSAVPVSGAEFVLFQAEGGEQPGEPAAEAAAPAGNDPAATPPAETTLPPGFTAPSLPGPGGPGDEPQYRPLDDELKATIRESIRRQRAVDALNVKTQQVSEEVNALVAEKFDPILPPEDPEDAAAAKAFEDRQRAAVREVVEALKKFGERPGVTFQETPLLSGQELYDSEDHPIGAATRWEPGRAPFDRDFTPVTQTVFESPPEQLLVPATAEADLTGSRFVYVKTEDVPPRTPEIGDEGVREAVVAAWKRMQARDLAEKRAQELAAKAKDAKQDLAALVSGTANQTVTGKEGGGELKSLEVGPFTWNRDRSAPSTGFPMPQITTSEVPQLENVGEEFMRTVFERLGTGEVGVAPNEERTVYYVVQVKDRTPASEEGYAALRKQFLDSRFDYLYPRGNEIGARARQDAITSWFRDLKTRYGVAVMPDPNAPPAVAPASL